MRDHRKLRAFQCADELALLIYQATTNFPVEERFGLTAQLRKGAVSVPSNIVEGSARYSDADYLRFLDIAYGAMKELQYQWSLATRLNYPSGESHDEVTKRMEKTARMLAGLIKANRRRVKN